METERKYEPIKESMGWYFVEYHPPRRGYKYANLNLVINKDADKKKVINAMEKELKNWLSRYPIPLMISAFDKKDDLYDLSELKPCNHLIGFLDKEGKICSHWELLKDEELPAVALNQEYVDDLYSKLSFKTYGEIALEHRKWIKQIKRGHYIFFVWLAIIPLLWELIKYSSNLLAIVSLIYSVYKAIQTGLEFFGKWPKSKRRKEKEEEERLKDHYYYHCQMNPEGFKRLKLENFEKMAIDDIEKEAASLKAKRQGS
ncbi:MAG: hypothetical protein P4L50_24465 [Anaerolineaceae bacterium]|nr:hypothetical protein [Anaerolineaceae bacterium]